MDKPTIGSNREGKITKLKYDTDEQSQVVTNKR